MASHVGLARIAVCLQLGTARHSPRAEQLDDVMVGAIHDHGSSARVLPLQLTTETRTPIGYLLFRGGVLGVNPAGVSTFLGAPTSIPEDGGSSWGSGTSLYEEEITSQKGFQIGH